MKIKNYLCPFFIIVLLLTSCSSDDGGDDLIVGTWRATASFQSGEASELPLCAPFRYVQYKADKSVTGGNIITKNTPEECLQGVTDFNVVWENLGNSNYRVGRDGEEGLVSQFYKDGANLVQEEINGVQTIYEPYQLAE